MSLFTSYLLRCALLMIWPPPLRLRTQVHQPVGSFDHIEVVLDHDDGVALIS